VVAGVSTKPGCGIHIASRLGEMNRLYVGVVAGAKVRNIDKNV